MAKIIITVLFAGILFNTGISPSEKDDKAKTTSCDIEVVLSAKSLPMYTYVLNSMGDLEDNAQVLEPVTMDDGTYSVSVTRKGTNLYKVDQRNIYLKTRYCYEYVYYQEAYLDLMKVRNIMVGELTFR